MSVAHRLYWNLLDKALLLEFVTWLRDQYPVLFKELDNQFIQHKEIEQR